MKGFIEIHELELEGRDKIHCVKLIPIKRIVEVYEWEKRVYVVHDYLNEEDGVCVDCVAESYEEIKKMIEESYND